MPDALDCFEYPFVYGLSHLKQGVFLKQPEENPVLIQ